MYLAMVAITPLMLPLEHAMQKMWESFPIKDTSNSCASLIIMLPIQIRSISANEFMISNKMKKILLFYMRLEGTNSLPSQYSAIFQTATLERYMEKCFVIHG